MSKPTKLYGPRAERKASWAAGAGWTHVGKDGEAYRLTTNGEFVKLKQFEQNGEPHVKYYQFEFLVILPLSRFKAICNPVGTNASRPSTGRWRRGGQVTPDNPLGLEPNPAWDGNQDDLHC